MNKKNKIITQGLAIFFVLFLVVALSGCDKGNKTDTSTDKKGGKQSDKSIVEKAQKTMEEQQGAKDKIHFVRTAKVGEEINIKYRLRDYKNVPKSNTSFDDIKKNLISLSGQATFKVKEIGQTAELSSIEKATGDKTYYYVIYEFNGSADTPTGSTIHPGRLDITGWDPAPALVIITSDNKPHFSRSGYNWTLARKKGLTKSLDIKLNNGKPETTVAVWKIKKSEKPILALKYISPEGEIEYIKIKQ